LIDPSQDNRRPPFWSVMIPTYQPKEVFLFIVVLLEPSHHILGEFLLNQVHVGIQLQTERFIEQFSLLSCFPKA
jgi:hypothetical protein